MRQVVDKRSTAAGSRRGVYFNDGLAAERFGLFCRLSVELQRSQTRRWS